MLSSFAKHKICSFIITASFNIRERLPIVEQRCRILQTIWRKLTKQSTKPRSKSLWARTEAFTLFPFGKTNGRQGGQVGSIRAEMLSSVHSAR
jgi:hypothetical protein